MKKFCDNYLTSLGRAMLKQWVSLEGEKEERAESLCKEIIAENFLNLGKKMEIQVHETREHLIAKIRNVFLKTHYIKALKS